MVEIKTIDDRTMYINTNYIVSITKDSYYTNQVIRDAAAYAEDTGFSNEEKGIIYSKYLNDHSRSKYIVQMSVGDSFIVDEKVKDILINYN